MEHLTTEQLQQRVREAKKCTWIGFAINGALALLKIIAGIIGRSGAMIADGIHSLSDFITDVIVIVFIGVTAKGIDKYYRYGHGKFETFATMLIAVALAIVALMLLADSVAKIAASLGGTVLPAPGYIALAMAFISILAKEWLFRYTKRVGDNIESMAIIANAWHHRSDALSSIATLVGIAGAIFLGGQWRILDPLAAALVSVFILIVAFRLGIPAVKELLEVSLPEHVNEEIGRVISGVDGVKAYHNLRTRKNGNIYIIDFHIKVDPSDTVVEAHDIASETERALAKKFGTVIANIHIEPYLGQQVRPNGSCLD